MKTRWYKDAVIYQIYPRSFCDSNGDGIGDIQGIISKLDYLKDLGIDAVWLSPCYASPNDDNGYDISDYRNIMTEFGTLDDWKEMIAGMHERGIKLIMDLVVNHCSDEHKWFIEARKSKDNPYRDYFFWREGKKNGKKPPNNWTSHFMGSAWEKTPETGEYYLHLFSKKQPDLNWDNPKVRQEVIDICNYWLELGVDGFRCDVIAYISKPQGLPDGIPSPYVCGNEKYSIGPNWEKYIEEVNRASWSKYDTMIVGECAIPYSKTIRITDENRDLLDTSFTFDHMFIDLFHKFRVRKLKKIFRKYQTVPAANWTSTYYENHDQPRSIPRFAPGGALRTKSAKMLATSIMFQRGTPYIYQGQEIGMTNCKFALDEYKDIQSINIIKTLKKIGGAPLAKLGNKALGLHARDNARTPMQWSAEKNAGFTTGEPWMKINENYTEINVEADMASDDSVIAYYKEAIKARKKVIELIKNGEYAEYNKLNSGVYVFSRKIDNQMLFVEINFSEEAQLVKLPKGLNPQNIQLLIANEDAPQDSIPATLLPLTARAYLITL